MAEMKTKFCKHCGQLIPEDAVICTHCGRQVEAIGTTGSTKDQPIIINNNNNNSVAASSAAAAAAAVGRGRTRRKYNALVDLILIICTGGLWIIWMLLRPKYY